MSVNILIETSKLRGEVINLISYEWTYAEMKKLDKLISDALQKAVLEERGRLVKIVRKHNTFGKCGNQTEEGIIVEIIHTHGVLV